MKLKLGDKVLAMRLPGPQFEVGWVQCMNDKVVCLSSNGRSSWDTFNLDEILVNLYTGEVRGDTQTDTI